MVSISSLLSLICTVFENYEEHLPIFEEVHAAIGTIEALAFSDERFNNFSSGEIRKILFFHCFASGFPEAPLASFVRFPKSKGI